MVQKRSLAVWVILCLLTFGIGFFVWMAGITRDVATMRKDSGYRAGATVVLLSIVTFGIYTLYWYYVTSQDIAKLDSQKQDNSVVNLVLGIFGFGIVSMVLMQNQINRIATAAKK